MASFLHMVFLPMSPNKIKIPTTIEFLFPKDAGIGFSSHLFVALGILSSIKGRLVHPDRFPPSSQIFHNFLSSKKMERNRMRGTRSENGVLKLVHPGRFVEIRRKPVTAAEVMSRNPRHCITRPDFFEFPWVVVKPESVLLPGSVFFIVPNHTVYNLIKARGHDLSQNKEIKRDPPVKSCAEMNPRLQSCKQYSKGKSRKIFPRVETLSMCGGWSKRYQKESQVELWPEVIDYRDSEKRIEEILQEESNFETRDYQTDSTDIDEKFSKDNNQEFVCNKNISKLKSCFRKRDSPRKLLNLSVSFDLPLQNEEL